MFYYEKIIFINNFNELVDLENTLWTLWTLIYFKLKVVGSDTCRYLHNFFHFFSLGKWERGNIWSSGNHFTLRKCGLWKDRGTISTELMGLTISEQECIIIKYNGCNSLYVLSGWWPGSSSYYESKWSCHYFSVTWAWYSKSGCMFDPERNSKLADNDDYKIWCIIKYMHCYLR